MARLYRAHVKKMSLDLITIDSFKHATIIFSHNAVLGDISEHRNHLIGEQECVGELTNSRI